MSSPTPRRPAPVSVEFREHHIDPICDRFEADWQSGEPPLIQDFVPAEWTFDQRWALLEHLLELEFHYRVQAD